MPQVQWVWRGRVIACNPPITRVKASFGTEASEDVLLVRTPISCTSNSVLQDPTTISLPQAGVGMPKSARSLWQISKQGRSIESGFTSKEYHTSSAALRAAAATYFIQRIHRVCVLAMNKFLQHSSKGHNKKQKHVDIMFGVDSIPSNFVQGGALLTTRQPLPCRSNSACTAYACCLTYYPSV